MADKVWTFTHLLPPPYPSPQYTLNQKSHKPSTFQNLPLNLHAPSLPPPIITQSSWMYKIPKPLTFQKLAKPLRTSLPPRDPLPHHTIHWAYLVCQIFYTLTTYGGSWQLSFTSWVLILSMDIGLWVFSYIFEYDDLKIDGVWRNIKHLHIMHNDHHYC